MDVDDVIGFDDEEEAGLFVVSKQGTKFAVDRKGISLSQLITEALLVDPSCNEVPITEPDDDVLKIITDYLNRHQGEAVLLPKERVRTFDPMVVCSKDRGDYDMVMMMFYKLPVDIVYRTLVSSAFMGIPTLTHLLAAMISLVVNDCKEATDVEGVLSRDHIATPDMYYVKMNDPDPEVGRAYAEAEAAGLVEQR